jgi:hypothetical protein
MSYQFRIPRQKDQSLVEALTAIRNELAGLHPLFLRVKAHLNGADFNLKEQQPVKESAIGFILAENSEIMPNLYLIDAVSGAAALAVNRIPTEITDQVIINWDSWISNVSQQDRRSAIFVKLCSSARRHLKPIEIEASVVNGGSSDWSRYRDSQQAVLSSLQETQKTLLVEFAKHALEAELTAKAKYDRLEQELRETHEVSSSRLVAEHKTRLDALSEREEAIKKREASFNTKEARYVTRQEQQNQIEQIKGWLKEWSLTKGTTTKRNWVLATYALGILATGGFTIWFSAANLEILKGADISKITWWQWVLLSLKSILPFVAFSTFITYFIRWSSDWARQHSEEEFRNRARILDIGRTAWLLEAVRDAQDNDKELPSDLLKELSRNLFSYNTSTDRADIHPQALSDALLQGLSSIRVKSADGTEVEASRSKK